MTKIKIDIDSSEKITNASINIVYENGIEEKQDVIITSEPNKTEEKLIKETDKKVIVKSGINEAFTKTY